MKTALTFIILIIATTAMAQQTKNGSYRQLSKSIDDDGKTLVFNIRGKQIAGQKLRYKRSFDVTNLSSSEKAALKNRVLDSLGINDVPKSQESGSETVAFNCESCSAKGRLEIYGGNFTATRIIDGRSDGNHSFPMQLRLNPGTYRLLYYEKHGLKHVLQIQSTFTVKANETNEVKVK